MAAKKASDLVVRLRTGFFYAIYIVAGAMLGNIGTLALVTITAGITS